MPDDPPPPEPPSIPPDEARAVDEVLAEFGGDARAAIAGLLHDLDALARDARAAVSRGFVRGDAFWRGRRPRASGRQ